LDIECRCQCGHGRGRDLVGGEFRFADPFPQIGDVDFQVRSPRNSVKSPTPISPRIVEFAEKTRTDRRGAEGAENDDCGLALKGH
jgi:hypothetical protein